jgi:hypothetical protein
MLLVEINLQSCRVAKQGALLADEYFEVMMDRIDNAPESWFKALQEIEKEKLRVAKAYNKRVREKSFQIGELVWKTIMSIGTRSGKLTNGLQVGRGPFG